MEKQIQKQYKQAQKEMTAKWNAYMENASKRISKLQEQYNKAVKAGEDVKELSEKLEDAKKNITLRNAQYKAMVDETTTRIANANQIALDYINDQTAGIYAVNYNSSKEIADNYKVNFTQVDENVIKNLMKEKHVNVQKDKAWNSKKLNSAVLQGILQGESIDKIAKRIMPICENNEKSAVRNARTMVTQAENRGRLDGYEELENEGLVMKKVWMATPDERTRESHILLDGEEVDIDEEFSNGLQYPADPEGDPAEVYNCRCTMVTKVVGYLDENGDLVELDENGETSLHEKQMEDELARRGLDGEDVGGIVDENEDVKETEYENEMKEKGYVGLSKEESDEFMEQYHNKKIIGKGHLNTMDGATSRRINNALRKGEMPSDEKDLKLIKRLDSEIEKNSLPEDMTLFRGVNLDAFKNTGVFDNFKPIKVSMNDFKNANGTIDYDAWGVEFGKAKKENLNNLKEMASKLVGTTIKDDGYMQVSASSQRNIFGFSDINMQIHAPKGLNAYISDYKEESEIILQRGIEYKIVGVDTAEYVAENGNRNEIVQLIIEIVKKKK